MDTSLLILSLTSCIRLPEPGNIDYNLHRSLL
jgi:hypothetical protein